MKTFEENINLEEDLTEVEPEPTFEEIIANIKAIQDTWVEPEVIEEPSIENA